MKSYAESELGSYVYCRAAPPDRVPASIEVAQHALRDACPGAQIGMGRCDCGVTVVMVCLGCGQPVLFFTKEGRWCQHADDLWGRRSA